MIGVVACSKSKGSTPAPAGELYTGRTFRAAGDLLRRMGARRLVILSALYGPVDEREVIAPYEATLIGASKATRAAWEAKAVPRLVELVGREPVVAIVPADYAGALRDVDARRLFVGFPQGALFSAIKRGLAVFAEVGEVAP